MTLLSKTGDIISKKFMACKNYLYKQYGENPGTMLVHTGVLGWILSSAAQITAVLINDKISSKEKMFLIPQEAADAAINILSFYLITNTFKSVASKLVKTGKLATPSIKKYITNAGLENSIGKVTTDISQKMPENVLKEYKGFKNGVDVLASTVGSVVSCNLITPVLRNQYASKKQKEILSKQKENNSVKAPAEPKLYRPLNMADYQKLATFKFSGSGNLKI